jgi:2-aminoadipate transaminase
MELPQRPGSRLDSYVDRYAARTRGMTASEIRALFAVASRPEVVSLAGGMPNLAALPLDSIAAVAEQLVREQGAVAMQYGSAQGDEALRDQICEVMRLEGIEGHPDDIIVTTGSQQALDLVTRIFVDPGDVVLAEGPSYVGALGVFASYQAQVVHVAMDDDGLVPDNLRSAIESVRATGRPIKFLYTIPNFHNPAGVTMSLERRPEILRICQEAGILILEDNPYGLLGFDGEPKPALRSLDSENVVYLGSFSKTFAPCFRVGWALAPHAVREKLQLAAEAAVLCPSAFSQMLVSRYLATQPWREQIKTFREMYLERRDATLSALTDLMPPGVMWTKPTGGFYVWLTLPPGIDSKAMLPRAVTARVAYVPGTGFYADGFGTSSLRLSYCYPTPERIREGVRRFAGVLEEEMELRAAFGQAVQGSSPGTIESRDTIDTPGPDLA